MCNTTPARFAHYTDPITDPIGEYKQYLDDKQQTDHEYVVRFYNFMLPAERGVLSIYRRYGDIPMTFEQACRACDKSFNKLKKLVEFMSQFDDYFDIYDVERGFNEGLPYRDLYFDDRNGWWGSAHVWVEQV